jgi:hypothetical protein
VTPREELQALRRLAELENKKSGRSLYGYQAERFNRGAMGTVGFAADIPAMAHNAGIATGGGLMAEPGWNVGPSIGQPQDRALQAVPDELRWDPTAGRAIVEGGRSLGMYGSEESLVPQTTAERYVGRAAEFAGAGAPFGPLVGRLGAITDAAVGTGQGLVYEGVMDATDGNQLAAAAASMAAPLAPAAMASTARGALGGGPRRMSAALQDAGQIPNFRPSAADAGAGDVAAVAERAGSYTIGSRGAVRQRADANDAALQAEAERIARAAEQLQGPRAPTQRGADAGQAIWQGLRADADSWFNRSRASAQAADQRAAQAIAAANQPVMVDVAPLLQRLQQGSIRQQEWGEVDPFLTELTQRLATAIQRGGGSIPFEAARRLKTHIGELTRWSGAAPGADVSLYRALYGELSNQMGQGIARLQSPAASRAWRQAQQQWAGHFERVRNYLDPVEMRLATPEHIINSVMAIGTPSRATALRRMVGERRWNQVRAYAIRRMGSSKPSGIEGTLAPGADDVFSPMTFATNWNAMQKSGHLETLFGGAGNRSWAQLRPELDRLARVAGRVQETRRSMYNSSGTAASGLPAAQVTGIGGAIAATPFLGPTPLLLAIGGPTGVAISSRLMMHPPFVRWLADSGQIPMDRVGVALARLGQLIEQEEDAEDRQAMIELYKQLGSSVQ